MTKRKSQRLLKEDTIRRFMKLANTQVLAEDFMDRTIALDEEEMEPGEEVEMGGEEPAMDMEAGEEAAVDAPAAEADVDEEVVEDGLVVAEGFGQRRTAAQGSGNVHENPTH